MISQQPILISQARQQTEYTLRIPRSCKPILMTRWEKLTFSLKILANGLFSSQSCTSRLWSAMTSRRMSCKFNSKKRKRRNWGASKLSKTRWTLERKKLLWNKNLKPWRKSLSRRRLTKKRVTNEKSVFKEPTKQSRTNWTSWRKNKKRLCYNLKAHWPKKSG